MKSSIILWRADKYLFPEDKSKRRNPSVKQISATKSSRDNSKKRWKDFERRNFIDNISI